MSSIRIVNARRGQLRLAYGVTLFPGPNEVDAEAWAKCKTHPITVHYIAGGEVSAGVPSLSLNSGQSEGAGTPANPRYEPVAMAQEQAADRVETTVVDTSLPPLQIEPEAEQAACASIDEMKAKDAITAIAAMDSVDDLTKLLRLEGRSTVVRAIDRRLEELED